MLTSLKPYLEPENLPDERAPVRACYRYLINRPGQFNYQDAIADDLPIGSGEIESAHGYVIHPLAQTIWLLVETGKCYDHVGSSSFASLMGIGTVIGFRLRSRSLDDITFNYTLSQ